MDRTFSPELLTQYAATLNTHGAPTCSIMGFLNCTICLMCQLSMSETLLYTGYKKCHGKKFQAVVVPDRMIAHLAGPYHAPQNDARVLVESRLLTLMHEHAIQPGSVEGDPLERCHFQLYGVVLGKFGPRPIGTRSGPDQTPRSRSQSGIFPKTPDRLVPGLGIPILPKTISDPVWTGTV